MASAAERVPATALLVGALFLATTDPRTCGAGDLTFRDAVGRSLSLAEVLPSLRAAGFVLIGEEHGNYRHHAVQIAILTALHDAGVPFVIGLEAFPTAVTPELARWVTGALDSAPLYRLFESNWHLDHWPAYRDLLFFLRDRRIPSSGINAEEALVRRVAREGYASLSAAEKRGLPPGGCAPNERYRALLARVVAAGALHEAAFNSLCEAQSLRDAVLSRELATLADARPGYLVVGLMGLYHAWKPSVPSHLAEFDAGRVLVILPADGPPGTAADLSGEGDFFWRWRD